MFSNIQPYCDSNYVLLLFVIKNIKKNLGVGLWADKHIYMAEGNCNPLESSTSWTWAKSYEFELNDIA